MLKSTHDQAQLSEKRGKNAVNKAETSDALDELALNQNQQQQQQQGGNSQILNSWVIISPLHPHYTHTHTPQLHETNPYLQQLKQQILEQPIHELITCPRSFTLGTHLNSPIHLRAKSQITTTKLQHKPTLTNKNTTQNLTTCDLQNKQPVLKSTHDQAMLSEKRGANAVNKAEANQCLDEVAKNTQVCISCSGVVGVLWGGGISDMDLGQV